MDERIEQFLKDNHAGIMVTTRPDGSAHVARLYVAIVEGKLVCSGTQTRVRTKHVRANPRATFCMVRQDDNYYWLGIEGRVTIHELPDAMPYLLGLRVATGRTPSDMAEFERTMWAEKRLVFELTPERVYGQPE